MNSTKPEKKNDDFQIAPSLIDFIVDDIEIEDDQVCFSLSYKFDADNVVYLTCKTINKKGEHYYLPKGSIDPQDELLHEYDYPETVGFAKVHDSHKVAVMKGQSIMLTEQQEQFLNQWMYNEITEAI